MRAIVLTSYGDPDVLTLTEVPDPVAGPEEVVVDVVATALNRADLLQRRGFYPEPGPPRAHEIPGMEFSGRVRSVGDRVSEWSVGDEVMAIVSGGAYAEQVVVHERQLLRIPTGVALADAAAIPEVGITAHDALVTQGDLRAGGWALVHAGASGVGSFAVQLVVAMGARVVTTTSTSKVAAVEALGATVVVDYGVDDFVAAAKEATGGAGIDVVLDVVGGDYLDRNLTALRTGGAIVQVGILGGGATSVNLGLLMARRARLHGTMLRSRPLEQKIDATRRFADQVLPALDAGRIRPVIDRRYPLAEIADAHRHLEANGNVGKVLIDVAD
jgi:putative PIG3 family NAD(P)H quinone oxidoreductase